MSFSLQEKKAKVQGVGSMQQPKVEPKKGVRQDIEDADDEESYYKWIEENPNAGKGWSPGVNK